MPAGSATHVTTPFAVALPAFRVTTVTGIGTPDVSVASSGVIETVRRSERPLYREREQKGGAEGQDARSGPEPPARVRIAAPDTPALSRGAAARNGRAGDE